MDTPDTALILVVDDEAASREPLEVLLQAEGYRTAIATNGRAALASIQRQLHLLDALRGVDHREHRAGRVLRAVAVRLAAAGPGAERGHPPVPLQGPIQPLRPGEPRGLFLVK